MSAISLSGIGIPSELLTHILGFCPPEQNVKNTQVCKEWQSIASGVVREQKLLLIERTMAVMESKAETFLGMAPEKDLGHYCPAFVQLAAARDNVENYSFEAVFDIVKNAIEKQHVCIGNFFRLDPLDDNISEELTAYLAGKVFVELHRTDSTKKIWENSNELYSIKYLPIAFFNLTVNGDEHFVKGNKNGGKVCLVLQGHFMELIIEKRKEENRQWSHCSFPGINRKTAVTIPLNSSSHIPTDGFVWPQEFYIAEYDAPPPREINEYSDDYD